MLSLIVGSMEFLIGLDIMLVHSLHDDCRFVGGNQFEVFILHVLSHLTCSCVCAVHNFVHAIFSSHLVCSYLTVISIITVQHERL